MNPEEYTSRELFEQSQKQVQELTELLKISQRQTDEMIKMYKKINIRKK